MALPKFCSDKSFKLASSGAGIGIIITLIMILQPSIDANAENISKISDKVYELDKNIAVSNERFSHIASILEELKDNSKMNYEKLDSLFLTVCSNSDFKC